MRSGLWILFVPTRMPIGILVVPEIAVGVSPTLMVGGVVFGTGFASAGAPDPLGLSSWPRPGVGS